MRSAFTPVLSAVCGALAVALTLACSGSDPSPAPYFTTQPVNVTLSSGASASFTVAACGDPAPTFTWERSDDAGSTWTAVSGATGATYTFTTQLADDRAQFRAKATNTYDTAISHAASLAVNYSNILASGACIMPGGLYVPGYWKNGTWVGLPVLDPARNATTTNLCLAGTDVYVTGGIRNSGGIGQAGYWQNDAWVPLSPLDPGRDAQVNDLLFSGSDVYAGGWSKDGGGNYTPGYWKNGVWFGLTPDGPSGIDGRLVSALAQSGSDLYALSQANGYWKNGTWFGLASGTVLNSIRVSGGDLYAAGYMGTGSARVAGYLKNGTWTLLPSMAGTTNAEATGLVLSGVDVYIVGFCDNTPGYWKNGVWTSLPTPTSGYAWAGSILVNRGDVYVGGYCTSGPGHYASGYWKNGTWVDLTPAGGATMGYVQRLVLQ